MKKSVYSIVLMDDVIKAVDEQAYRMGTSRSNLINQILAQHLSCTTPEMRMRDIFGSLEELIGEAMQIQQQRSASLLTMRSALDYKYHPTICYKVELDRAPREYLGTLKVQIRTQSRQLREIFDSFFVQRVRKEAELLLRAGYEYPEWKLSPGCFTRRLINSGEYTDDRTGEAIAQYINDLNYAIQVYFSDPGELMSDGDELMSRYTRMVSRFIV